MSFWVGGGAKIEMPHFTDAEETGVKNGITRHEKIRRKVRGDQ